MYRDKVPKKLEPLCTCLKALSATKKYIKSTNPGLLDSLTFSAHCLGRLTCKKLDLGKKKEESLPFAFCLYLGQPFLLPIRKRCLGTREVHVLGSKLSDGLNMHCTLITVMIRLSALHPISAPFQISAPLQMWFC